MKFAALGAVFALFAWFGVTALPAAAQETTASSPAYGTSPDLHASFEYEYALEATAMSVNQAHREKIASIVREYESGALSEGDASKRIDAMLSPQELSAVAQIEGSLWASLLQIYANAGAINPSEASIQKGVPEIDPGHFLILLLQASSPSPATAQ